MTYELLQLPLQELKSLALKRRQEIYGNRVTYSPKVFIPLTRLCRDRCGYCTFATAPSNLNSPFLSQGEILEIARRGAFAGCHEALFTLGEAPEDRYVEAREWLSARGFDSTVDYLAAMCKVVLDETGLLPHVNAGALSSAEMAKLAKVSVSQGMMIESERDDLFAHKGAPDKSVARRYETLEAAGELKIPFTTGLLVGIGDTVEDRYQALLHIARVQERYGHIQEVIIQNFLPKPKTAMAKFEPCSPDDHYLTIALARLILPPEIHLQAPPNLSDAGAIAELLDCGIDDFGGVSPVTIDHVNPERPWPEIDLLRQIAESQGMTLAPRLAVYPEFVRRADEFVDGNLRFAIMDRSDAEGLGRDDPGSIWPERSTSAEVVGTGAEVVQIGRKSTIWTSGANFEPTEIVEIAPNASSTRRSFAVNLPSATSNKRTRITEILDGVAAGEEVGFSEISDLFKARGNEVRMVADVADQLREEIVGDDITFVVNRNINYTNVCTFKCRFCGFSKGPLSLNLRGKPYLLTLEDIVERAREAFNIGASEVCLQGGIHPNFDGDFYVDVAKAIHDAIPEMHIHGFTALEVFEGARRLDIDLASYLKRLMAAGLKSLPGTAAEILVDSVREILCPDKINTSQWLEVHEVAHSVGLRSNVTMMFGAVESPDDWATHIVLTRDLQKRTGGFTEFVGLPFVHNATPLYLTKRARRGPTWREVLLVHAVARIAYRNTIPNVQASWVKLGVKGASQLLRAGVNDLGGTLMEENISRAAGAEHGQYLDADGFARIAAAVGRPLRQRNTLYGSVLGPVLTATI